ncbi:hypothetical protein N9Y92_03140 [Chlamydiales bacterium]|nr:hypothetical protein [Chlamydiales bacterium]
MVLEAFLTQREIENSPYTFQYEHAHVDIIKKLGEHMSKIQETYNKGIDLAEPFVEADYQPIEDARQLLILLATNPKSIGTVADNEYMTVEMAEALDPLLKTFELAGFDLPGKNGVDKLNDWIAQSVVGLGGLIDKLVLLGDPNKSRSIQAMVELDYIKTGNELITTKLSDLENALRQTQGAIVALSELQDLYNLAKANQTTTFKSPEGDFDSPDDFVTSYKTEGDQVFNNPITVDVTAIGTTEEGKFEDLKDEINRLRDEIARVTLHPDVLAEVTDGSGNFDYTLLTLKLKDEMNGSLAHRLDELSTDIQDAYNREAAGEAHTDLDPVTNLPKTLTAAQIFVMDHFGYGSENDLRQLSGDYGRTLTLAQVASQALNDEQKESVRRTLFVFEEFYKSASGMLIKISQLVERMAQNISR